MKRKIRMFSILFLGIFLFAQSEYDIKKNVKYYKDIELKNDIYKIKYLWCNLRQINIYLGAI